MYLITRSNLHPFRSCNRLLTTWVNGYTKGSFEERKIVIENNVLPLLQSPQPSQAIAQDLNKSVGGITTAMQLRTDIQKLSDTSISNASLSKLDECIQDWLSVVFCVDSLSLEHITFDSSGTTLERIARSDTVHAVRSISSLKKRLHNGRRCYALVHHALPNYPLAFIHVALTSQLANSMRYGLYSTYFIYFNLISFILLFLFSSLDSLNDRVSPSHAMFYSVNSTSPAFRKSFRRLFYYIIMKYIISVITGLYFYYLICMMSMFNTLYVSTIQHTILYYTTLFVHYANTILYYIIGGLSLAPHLIKEVVRDLQLTCPGIRVFSTLSPIPNFMKWINKVRTITLSDLYI